ncbi:MAG: hypothetical protein ACYS0G_05850 [Planctomycetota bacterium]
MSKDRRCEVKHRAPAPQARPAVRGWGRAAVVLVALLVPVGAGSGGAGDISGAAETGTRPVVADVDPWFPGRSPWASPSLGVPLDPLLQAVRWLREVVPGVVSHRTAAFDPGAPRVQVRRPSRVVALARGLTDRGARVMRRTLSHLEERYHALVTALKTARPRALPARAARPAPIFSPILGVPVTLSLLPANLRDPEPLWAYPALVSPIDGMMLGAEGTEGRRGEQVTQSRSGDST